ncbi:hypothetical protein QJS10_CPA09g00390 [Acorus calamus]|uniref:Uncharacterized protein n=1 Tax=Acorus calamus TaxID=4465 RepID=A0AAV9E7K0_ACOCL|nr:hypothetical protein QJS10_CPA09g00390 [Acorus calamus]
MKRAALRLLPCLNQRPKTTKHFSQSSNSTLSESSTYLQIFKALDQPQTHSDLYKVHSLVPPMGSPPNLC